MGREGSYNVLMATGLAGSGVDPEPVVSVTIPGGTVSKNGASVIIRGVGIKAPSMPDNGWRIDRADGELYTTGGGSDVEDVVLEIVRTGPTEAALFSSAGVPSLGESLDWSQDVVLTVSAKAGVEVAHLEVRVSPQ